MTLEFADYYVIQPSHSFWNSKDYTTSNNGKVTPCADGFAYRSDTNPQWLDVTQIAELVRLVESDPIIKVKPEAGEATFFSGA